MLDDTLNNQAKNLSRKNVISFGFADAQPFIDEAIKIPGVENVKACSCFIAKTSDYPKRCFDRMIKVYKDVIESDNDMLSIGFWHDESQNCSVSCFLFHFK